jgi:hypothetical protein
MGCGVSRSPRVEEAKTKAALTAKPHASAVARESKGMWSYSIVSRAWRIAGTLLRRPGARQWAVIGCRAAVTRRRAPIHKGRRQKLREQRGLAAQLLAISRAGAGIGSGLCYRSAKGFPPPVFRDLGSNGTRPRF